MKEKFTLKDEKRNEILSQIRTFFEKERDEKIGEVAARKVLTFFIDKLAIQFYNQGIEDAYNMMSENVQDILSLKK